MQGLNSQHSRNAMLGAIAVLLLTPAAFFLSARGLSAQGYTSTFESTVGQLVQNGESVEYTYRVDGEQFTGKRRTFLPGGSKVALGNVVSLADPVSVYYDPMHPEQAVLVPGTEISDFLGALMALICGPAIAAGLWYFALRARAQEAGLHAVRVSPVPTSRVNDYSTAA